jgi:predicted DNA-binding protein
MKQTPQEPEPFSLSIRVDREMYTALKDIAKRNDRPVAAQIRRFIQAGLDSDRDRLAA